MRASGPEVYYPDERLVVAGGPEMRTIRTDALSSARGRSRLCAHPDPDAAVHEMLIAHTDAVYVRPHRHHGKDESLLLLEGELDALFFEDDGTVRERRRMRAYGGDAPFYYRIPPGVWHGLVIVSPLVVFLEVTAGPFRREQTEFPVWAPDGSDADAAARYVAALRQGAVA